MPTPWRIPWAGSFTEKDFIAWRYRTWNVRYRKKDRRLRDTIWRWRMRAQGIWSADVPPCKPHSRRIPTLPRPRWPRKYWITRNERSGPSLNAFVQRGFQGESQPPRDTANRWDAGPKGFHESRFFVMEI